MENIIKKAVEGGYEGDKHFLVNLPQYAQYQLLCDPLFWQALGKAKGWKKVYDDPKLCNLVGKDWKDYALQFHKINLTQGHDNAFEWLEEQVN